ncbi:unnamed protein product, partial [Ixodes persulcatus]
EPCRRSRAPHVGIGGGLGRRGFDAPRRCCCSHSRLSPLATNSASRLASLDKLWHRSHRSADPVGDAESAPTEVLRYRRCACVFWCVRACCCSVGNAERLLTSSCVVCVCIGLYTQ